jgi:integrase
MQRQDTREWESRPKYGTRLTRQVGTEKFKSKVPDPARPGSYKAKTFRASGWQEAERQHRDRLGLSERNELPQNTNQTLDELAERRWDLLAGLVATGERAETTLESDQLLYRKHIRPVLGRMKVSRMTTANVSRLLTGLRQNGLAPTSITRIYSVLRSILNLEPTASGILTGLAYAERPSSTVPRRESRCLTDEQVGDLLYFSLPATKTLNAIIAYTGMRQSEALGLVWDDFDLLNGIVHVRAQLARKKRGEAARRRDLKTSRRLGGRNREIDLHPDLVAIVKAHKAEQFSKGLASSGDYVVCTAEGHPMYYRNALRDLQVAAKRAGLTADANVVTHDLRHTAASRWIAAGLDAATVARMIGDNIETVLKVYAHEFDKARRRQEIREKLVAGTRIEIA